MYRFRSLPWAKQGDAVGWLTSPVFGLKQARSSEGENAFEAAKAFMRGDIAGLPRRFGPRFKFNASWSAYSPATIRFGLGGSCIFKRASHDAIRDNQLRMSVLSSGKLLRRRG